MPDVIDKAPDPLLIEEMSRFLNLPWFQRLWIFQEVILSNRLLLRWENLEFDHDHLSAIFQGFMALARKTDSVEGPEWYRLAIIFRFRINCQTNRQFTLLDFLINAARAFHCSDKRDKIFAFCGIPGVRQSGMPPVNYRQPAAAVYRDFSRFLIQSSGRLDVFTAVTMPVNTVRIYQVHLRGSPIGVKNPRRVELRC